MAITIDNRSQASIEGGLRVQALRYARYFPVWPFLLVAALVAGGVCFLKSAAALVLLIPAVLLNWIYWSHIKAHFSRGCVNPGKLVAEEPFLIAVYTDLSTGDDLYPVIKILKHPKPVDCALRVGDRLGTVALYSGPATAGHWTDFRPKLMACATDDRAAIQRAVDKIPETEWIQFERELQRLPLPWKPGLYPVA